MDRILFISENLVIESHTGEILSGLKLVSDKVIALDYFASYLNNGKKKFEKQIIELIENEKIQLLIIGLGTSFVIDPKFIIKISNKYSLKVCIIFGDPEHNFEHHDRYYAQCSDLCWIFSPGASSLFSLYGFSIFDQLGLFINHRNFGNYKKIYDVSFIGGLYRGDRSAYINFLESNSIKIFLAGSGSKKGIVTNDIKDEIIQSSKIHLNFSKVENKRLNIFSRVNQFKGRLYESYMLGTFCLTEYYHGIEEHLGPKHNKICFNSKEELLNKINYYLLHDDERKALTNYFNKLILEKFSSERVSKNLINKINKIEFKKKYFIYDKQFSEDYFSNRIYYFFWFIGKGKFSNAVAEFGSLQKEIFQVKFVDMAFQIARGLYHSFKK